MSILVRIITALWTIFTASLVISFAANESTRWIGIGLLGSGAYVLADICVDTITNIMKGE